MSTCGGRNVVGRQKGTNVSPQAYSEGSPKIGLKPRRLPIIARLPSYGILSREGKAEEQPPADDGVEVWTPLKWRPPLTTAATTDLL